MNKRKATTKRDWDEPQRRKETYANTTDSTKKNDPNMERKTQKIKRRLLEAIISVKDMTIGTSTDL